MIAIYVYRYIYIAKTKMPIGCALTAQLICAFVFTKAKGRFSHDAAHLEQLLLLASNNSNCHHLAIENAVSSLKE